MIWFAWRQFRVQALIALVLLLALGAAFLVTGPHLLHTYHSSIVGCRARRDCSAAKGSYLSAYPFLQNLLTESPLLPILIGMFWGAPIVAREFDTGTFRLAWTQSVSRSGWLGAKVLVGGLATLVTAGAFTLMATWWSSPLDRVRDTPFSLFNTRDIVPVGYALFAFALGVALGAVVRRVIPAMVLSIAGFAGVSGVFIAYIRPHYFAPRVANFRLGVSGIAGPNQADWTISSVVKNAAGKVFPQLSHGVDFRPIGKGVVALAGVGRCPNTIPGSLGGSQSGPPKAVRAALNKCIDSFHLHESIVYQPVSRYWSFQWCELASLVVLSLILMGFSLWWIQRP
jgi:hypothetical protein